MKYINGEMYDRSTKDSYRKLWYELVEHYLDMYLPKEGKVLDAGGGTGEFCIRAARLRPKLSFINFDISDNMLNTARAKINKLKLDTIIQCWQGDIMNLPYEDDSFEYVMCLGDALSFCADWEKAFSELARVVAPRGLLHVSVNSFWGNLTIMLDRGQEKGFGFKDIKEYYETHIIHQNGKSTGCKSFTVEELREMGKKRDLVCTKTFVAPVFPIMDDLLDEKRKYNYMLELQYKHCEDERFIDFGNHINMIFQKNSIKPD